MLNPTNACQDRRLDPSATIVLSFALLAMCVLAADADDGVHAIHFASTSSGGEILAPAINFGSPRPAVPPTNRVQVAAKESEYRQGGEATPRPQFATDVQKAVHQQGDDINSVEEETRGTWSLEPMSMLNVDIQTPEGILPSDYAPDTGTCDSNGLTCGRGWSELRYCYVATGMYHNPLYFEEANLERYGYGCQYCLQPAVSAAHFFARVPALPYLMAVECPGECNYTLGHYRPGDCVPWRRYCAPCKLRGGLSQAGAVTALVFLLP